eukprot:CAMPEP_0175040520 /NCGR_PEP_ID=MMETSP0052_2-20121109/1315_1 /TAXON_ID=51329 ORGANISM="Polytomella parva, Strain SAG 63-3" /NCGR_SAMPLE_ID=MMETSP0052_2 /ASSEMBLY_ACC=CAM_ASM_000194 /LENGTH=389 /DNA_ID=CAMNT_0016302753 /DNA_START=86 /DNA_END=1252 /DNA_ORIENTATION=+
MPKQIEEKDRNARKGSSKDISNHSKKLDNRGGRDGKKSHDSSQGVGHNSSVSTSNGNDTALADKPLASAQVEGLVNKDLNVKDIVKELEPCLLPTESNLFLSSNVLSLSSNVFDHAFAAPPHEHHQLQAPQANLQGLLQGEGDVNSSDDSNTVQSNDRLDRERYGTDETKEEISNGRTPTKSNMAERGSNHDDSNSDADSLRPNDTNNSNRYNHNTKFSLDRIIAYDDPTASLDAIRNQHEAYPPNNSVSAFSPNTSLSIPSIAPAASVASTQDSASKPGLSPYSILRVQGIRQVLHSLTRVLNGASDSDPPPRLGSGGTGLGEGSSWEGREEVVGGEKEKAEKEKGGRDGKEVGNDEEEEEEKGEEKGEEKEEEKEEEEKGEEEKGEE